MYLRVFQKIAFQTINEELLQAANSVRSKPLFNYFNSYPSTETDANGMVTFWCTLKKKGHEIDNHYHELFLQFLPAQQNHKKIITHCTSVQQFCHFLVGCSPLRILRRLADMDVSKSLALYFLFKWLEGNNTTFRIHTPPIQFTFMTVIANVVPRIPS